MTTETTEQTAERIRCESRDAEARLRREGGPLWRCRWERAVFLHGSVPAAILAREVPFPLDLLDGDAVVSLVAFDLVDMRPTRGPRLLSPLVSRLASHLFLNVRTYVKVGGERGIFFLAEFVPSRLSAFLGPRAYGLPYRHARLEYRVDLHSRRIAGRVEREGADVSWLGSPEADLPLASAGEGTPEEWLFERYSAFTRRRGVTRRFRVWHPPWRFARVGARVRDRGLLATTGAWARRWRFTGAHVSPGFDGVEMGRPVRLDGSEG